MRARLTAIPILILALLLVGCANKTRTLAVAGYQTSQVAHALVDSAEQAHASGVLSTPDYQNFLAAVDKVADAGLVYHRALIAYLSAKNEQNAGELGAALAALMAAYAALPDSVTNAVFRARVEAETAKVAPVLAEAQQAGGAR